MGEGGGGGVDGFQKKLVMKTKCDINPSSIKEEAEARQRDLGQLTNPFESNGSDFCKLSEFTKA
uniref:Uncharacterized protein n=1 Tax=Cucumis sativus TaxID=3659 RepID=A0A0A0KLS4_CUCSA